MPGEPYDTDSELGAPWTLDPETDALTGQLEEQPTEAAEEPAPTEEPEVTEPTPVGAVQPNGDVVNDSGQVIGHVEPNQEAS